MYELGKTAIIKNTRPLQTEFKSSLNYIRKFVPRLQGGDQEDLWVWGQPGLAYISSSRLVRVTEWIWVSRTNEVGMQFSSRVLGKHVVDTESDSPT